MITVGEEGRLLSMLERLWLTGTAAQLLHLQDAMLAKACAFPIQRLAQLNSRLDACVCLLQDSLEWALRTSRPIPDMVPALPTHASLQ